MASSSPWRRSDGAVRKNRPLSVSADNAGDVADGEIMTRSFGIATLFKTAMVTPEQAAPIRPTIFSELTRRSAEAVAALESMQVLSPRLPEIVWPPRNRPLSEASAIASSAEAPIWGVRDSTGPVKPSRIPILTSSAIAADAKPHNASAATDDFKV